MTTPPSSVVGFLSRDVEWGIDGRTGEPWAKLDLQIQHGSPGTAEGPIVVVLASGEIVTNTVRALSKGDRLHVVGRLITSGFHTEDGELEHLEELHANDIYVV